MLSPPRPGMLYLWGRKIEVNRALQKPHTRLDSANCVKTSILVYKTEECSYFLFLLQILILRYNQ